MRRWVTAVGCALCAGAAATAWADSNHYVNLLVGDRATGLAGAYTALSEDASGLFYNPAGTVYAGDLSVSANVNAYRKTDTEYSGGLLGGRGWTRKSSALVPNFFGVVVPAGGFHLGFSYAVPDSTVSDQDQEFENITGTAVPLDRFRINFNEADTTYNVGPSVAFRLFGRLPVGLTLYGHSRQRELISNQLVSLSDGTYQSLGYYLDSDEYGVRPLLGTVVELGDHAALGVSGSRTFVISSDTRVQETVKAPGAEAFTETVTTSGKKRIYPYRVAGGLAWFPTNAVLLSADVIYHTATDDDLFGDRDATWNWALGAEYYFSSAWALRGGAFSDLANTPEVSSGRTDQMEHVDIYGASTSVTHYTATSALTLGGIYQRGSGEAQIVGGSSSVQDVDVTSVMVFLSAAYRH